LQSFDNATGTATFLMLDALPNGSYALHLSGPLGLADFAGNTLAANDPSGDYVIPFSINGPARGSGGNPLVYTYQDGGLNNGVHVQDLGILFPLELQAKMTVLRMPALVGTSRLETMDAYSFQVLQDQDYVFILNGPNGASLPPGVQLVLLDGVGNVVPTSLQAGGNGLLATLHPGTYILFLEGLPPDPAGTLGYQLTLALGGSADQAPALTSGPAPARRVRLVGGTPAAPAAAPVNPPATPVPARPAPALRGNGVVEGLAVLTSGPVGGVTAPLPEPGAPEQMLVRVSDNGVLAGLTQLLVLTTASGCAEGESSAGDHGLAEWRQPLGDLIHAVAAGVAELGRAVPACLDRLFDVADGPGEDLLLAAEPVGRAPAATPHTPAVDRPEPDLVSSPVATSQPQLMASAGGKSWLWAVLATAGGGAAVLKWTRRSRRPVPVPRILRRQALPETLVVGDRTV
jgi:hypothetical protein